MVGRRLRVLVGGSFFVAARTLVIATAVLVAPLDAAATTGAPPIITTLVPPSELFAAGDPDPPYIARFVPGQRFDLQATVVPAPGRAIAAVAFRVDDEPVGGTVTLTTTGLRGKPAPGTTVATRRAYSATRPGVHVLTVEASQDDGRRTVRRGNFEVVEIAPGGPKARNVIIMLGDGMGAAHRTAARVVLNGVAQGKAKRWLAMDTFPVTALVTTSSLNALVTDSAPGMQSYVTGNKSDNGEEGVWPDETTSPFDNPRVEYLSEYLARLDHKKLGIVTTADVFDATPASMAVHTADRGAGTGIVDQYLDDAAATGLTVLMGGGRKWFLPRGAAGSARDAASDYVLPPDVVAGWGVRPGLLDPGRDLIGDFRAAGFSYVGSRTGLERAGTPERLLGLFALSNMNVALDKIEGRRGQSSVVDDYGFPDQPMLDEMVRAALAVLDARSPDGFVLLAEGASIDKQSHAMDTARWIVDTIEFDRAVAVARDYAAQHDDTLVIVTADHECGGAAIIGGSRLPDAELAAKSKLALRDDAVGTYERARFPHYEILADGYPKTLDVDFEMLVGYAAGPDHFEDWRSDRRPLHDGQQPFDDVPPLGTYPRLNAADPASARPIRDQRNGFAVTGQVPGGYAAHTATDVPLSAYGRGAASLGGVLDNTDVFFRIVQAVVGGVRR